MQLYIIYTETAMLLSKRNYASWLDIQDEYRSYKASLGPWEQDEVAEYLSAEYSALSPPAKEQIATLLSASSETIELTFRRPLPAA
jgi:hypothetical protein